MFEDDIYSKYIMSILGYQNSQNNICGNNNMNNCNYNQNIFNLKNQENNIEEYYPEIYKVVYPMIRSACNKNNLSISAETIEKITNDIYFAIEAGKESTTINVKNENTKTVKFETDKTQRSSYLKELIKILLIREFREKNNNVGMENRYFENNENKYMTRMQKNRNFYKDISHFDIYENS